MESIVKVDLKTREEQIIDMVKSALETTPYGRIIIELRGPESSADVIVEQRTRFQAPSKRKEEGVSHHPQGGKPRGYRRG